jgi:hypothetical protein
MKRTFILIFLFLASYLLHAQNEKSNEIPSSVKSEFSSLYPGITDVKWSKEDGNFEAEFKVEKVETSVVIDSKGNLMETEQEISTDQLPKQATDYIAGSYPGKKIAETAKITDSKGTVTYEVQIGKSDLIFDAEGTFIKKAEARD